MHRFIPACAGWILATDTYRQCISVYPRVCGVDTVGFTSLTGVYGLSPRVRGRFDERYTEKSPDRFIPACAG